MSAQAAEADTVGGGITGPALFGRLVDSPGRLTAGFLVAAGLMLVAAIVELVLGIDAEQESLEDISTPLTAEAAADGRAAGERAGRGAGDRDLVQRGNRFSRPAWSPTAMASSRPRMDRDLEREVAAIVSVLPAGRAGTS